MTDETDNNAHGFVHRGGAIPNPKDAVGSQKYPMTTVSQAVMAEVGVAMLEGALKYGRHNYREAGIICGVNMAAIFRHFQAFWEGEDLDPDTKAVDPKTQREVALSHVTKLIAAATVLRDGMLMGNWVDDRPPRLPEGWIENCNAMTRALTAKYPQPIEAFTEKHRRPAVPPAGKEYIVGPIMDESGAGSGAGTRVTRYVRTRIERDYSTTKVVVEGTRKGQRRVETHTAIAYVGYSGERRQQPDRRHAPGQQIVAD